MAVTDFTSIVMLKNVYELYEAFGKKLKIRNMNRQSKELCINSKLLHRSIFFEDEN